MNKNGRLNRALRLIAFVMGIVILLISVYWSQDGFNFGPAGDGGYTQLALIIGLALAIGVTVMQFVFSTNFRELNGTLILLGFISYGYSIWTNKEGITHFQGTTPNEFAAWFLGFCIDVAPEPLIGWALGESLSGDFVGNTFKSIGNMFGNAVGAIMDGPKQDNKPKQEFHADTRPPQQHGQGKKRREFLESGEWKKSNPDKPNHFSGFGE